MVMVPRTLVLVMLALLFVAPLSPAPAASEATDLPCPGYEVVPHQGPSCPTEGGWWVLLGDGTRLLTHGPDPLPAPEDIPALPAAADATGGPVCARDPATDPHMLLVYTVPVDRPDRYLTMADRVRDMARNANAFLRAEAAALGGVVDYKVRCDPLGGMEVAHEILATPSSQDNFVTITTELRARGYTSPLVKYWVWHDDRVPGIGGQGNIAYSDAPSLMNKNNIGPSYALTYGYDSWFIMMHENGHNMGAVQRDAPESSGAAHCNDGRDVMCYSDGGYKSAYRTVCSGLRFDCGHDSYFHPHPAPGNWLYDHWNLASPLNRYVHIEDACEPRIGAVTDSGLGVPVSAWEEDLPASCGGRFFTLTSAEAEPFVTRDFAVCWYAGTTLLSCFDTPRQETGTVPMGADRAEITYEGTGGSVYLLMVN